MLQCRVPTVQTVQMTVEIFQVLLSGPVFDMPVVVQRHMHCPRGQGRRHLRRGADAVSYGPDCSENIEILQLLFIDKVFDVTVGQVQQIPRVLSV